MSNPDVEVDPETVDRLRARILQEEDNQLHFERPPRIIKDIRAIIEEEVTEVSLDGEEM